MLSGQLPPGRCRLGTLPVPGPIPAQGAPCCRLRCRPLTSASAPVCALLYITTNCLLLQFVWTCSNGVCFALYHQSHPSLVVDLHPRDRASTAEGRDPMTGNNGTTLQTVLVRFLILSSRCVCQRSWAWCRCWISGCSISGWLLLTKQRPVS